MKMNAEAMKEVQDGNIAQGHMLLRGALQII